MTNFRLFQTQRVHRRHSNLVKITESCPKKVENTVRKGDIARNEQFLLFPQGFQKTSTANM